jgi:hypothetical protein
MPVMPAFGQGNLFVCTAAMQGNLDKCTRNTVQEKLVDRTHEKVNLSRKTC